MATSEKEALCEKTELVREQAVKKTKQVVEDIDEQTAAKKKNLQCGVHGQGKISLIIKKYFNYLKDNLFPSNSKNQLHQH